MSDVAIIRERRHADTVRRVLVTAGILLAAGALPAGQAAAREVVPFDGYTAGKIIVNTRERRLYYVNGDGTAVRYKVGVGKRGRQWQGEVHVDGKYRSPAWVPPEAVRRDNPALPDLIPGGAPGNPMGAAALTLSGGEYAIHGTNRPDSIGGFVSYGCIRMYNDDVVDLFERVEVGATVLVQ
jgi:lipoprotein-anchoring transpeptidase ErfK/SrfK